MSNSNSSELPAGAWAPVCPPGRGNGLLSVPAAAALRRERGDDEGRSLAGSRAEGKLPTAGARSRSVCLFPQQI